MKDKYPKNKDFPGREATLKHLRERSHPEDFEKMDDHARRAFRGLQRFESPQALEASLCRLDQRFEGRLRQGDRPSLFRRIPASLRIAASILILLVPAAAWFLLRQPAPVNSSYLFDQYFSPTPSAIPLSGALRGPEKPRDLKRQAINAYEATDYEKAIADFEAYLRQQPDDTEVRFYFGIALLARRQAPQAIDQLQMVYRQPPRPSYRPAAAWYLGLAYIQNGQEQQGAQYLEELAKANDNDYHQQAVKLLKQLGYDVSFLYTTTPQAAGGPSQLAKAMLKPVLFYSFPGE